MVMRGSCPAAILAVRPQEVLESVTQIGLLGLEGGANKSRNTRTAEWRQHKLTWSCAAQQQGKKRHQAAANHCGVEPQGSTPPVRLRPRPACDAESRVAESQKLLVSWSELFFNSCFPFIGAPARCAVALRNAIKKTIYAQFMSNWLERVKLNRTSSTAPNRFLRSSSSRCCVEK